MSDYELYDRIEKSKNKIKLLLDDEKDENIKKNLISQWLELHEQSKEEMRKATLIQLEEYKKEDHAYLNELVDNETECDKKERKEYFKVWYKLHSNRGNIMGLLYEEKDPKEIESLIRAAYSIDRQIEMEMSRIAEDIDGEGEEWKKK